jgi:hypothetical protein
MRWYYGPGTQQDILHVFKSTFEPTERSHGHWIRYAIGPWNTRQRAIDEAHGSQGHPGYRVFVKLRGPYSKEV